MIGLNMHLYNPRHLPKVTVDYEDVELNPLKPMQVPAGSHTTFWPGLYSGYFPGTANS